MVHAAENPPSQFFAANGVKIHYVRQGSGSPVVLIHGLYSDARLNWQAPGIFSALAKDHDVIAFDLPGHGLSDKPDDAAAYGTQMAEDVGLLLDHLQIPRAQIVGYSLGGLVALKFTVLHPDRVLACALGGMGWMEEGGDVQKSWARKEGHPGFTSTPAICVSSVAQLAVTAAELKSVKVPVEVLVGDRDPVMKLYVTPLESIRPDWPVVRIQGAGHIMCVVKPQFRVDLVAWVNADHRL